MSAVRMVGGPFNGRDVDLPDCPPVVRIGHPIRAGLPPDTIETYERGALVGVIYHVRSDAARDAAREAGHG